VTEKALGIVVDTSMKIINSKCLAVPALQCRYSQTFI